ncbi:hypothetical protein [Streptomyces sp. NPDC002825]|uniref:hypothetical protein n=1 Tax=Streptomyces sp. NPDC002825 TaxID=3154666 RepID=UPI0033341030
MTSEPPSLPPQAGQEPGPPRVVPPRRRRCRRRTDGHQGADLPDARARQQVAELLGGAGTWFTDELTDRVSILLRLFNAHVVIVPGLILHRDPVRGCASWSAAWC